MNQVKWMGGNVSASVMSPEPCTEISKNTNVNDYIIRKNTSNYIDLKLAKICPESINPLFVNHLYTVKNYHYDILKVGLLFEMYTDLLNLFPVSMYLLINVYEIDFKDFFDKYESGAELENDDIDSYYSFLILLMNERSNSNLKNLSDDIVKYECIISKRIRGEQLDSDSYIFNFSIQSIYNELKKLPFDFYEKLNSYIPMPTKIRVK